MKTIIRIGGTGYSGSTLLDLMLANADDAFSCGEMYALFRPTLPHHINPLCTCMNTNCHIWNQVKAQGEKHVWTTLSSMFPRINTFVDSSKYLVWYLDQQRSDHLHTFVPYNLLIWKTPEEYAHSCMKRGVLKKWKKTYIHYHTSYFSIMNNWISVRYSDLVKNPIEKLKKLCSLLNIGYLPGKELFWNRQYHTLFGSHSAKIHLHDKDSQGFNNSFSKHRKPNVNQKEEPEIRYHKTLYYDRSAKICLDTSILKEIETDESLNKILRVLEMTEVDGISAHNPMLQHLINELKPRPGWYLQGKIKRYIASVICKINH